MNIHIASSKEIKAIQRALNKCNMPYIGVKKLDFSMIDMEIAYMATVDGELAGFCYADKNDSDSRTRKTVSINYFVLPDFRNGGLGTELVKLLLGQLHLRGFIRVECCITEENISSQKLVEKLGFKREATLKKRFITDDGRLLDDFFYGKIFDEQKGAQQGGGE